MNVERDATEVPDYAGAWRLDGTVHVVLGAGMGIGRQTAHALASVGAKVVCVDVAPRRAELVAAEVDGVPWSGDLTVREDVQALFRFVRDELGRLDGVVDIVGGARSKPLLELTDDDWMFHHDIVLRHAYLAIQYAAEHWRSTGTGGTMTFVASVTGFESSPRAAAYGAHKAALMSLVRTAAVELGPDGIRVNAVAPGIVRTPRAQANEKWTDELLAANIAKTPLRKLARPADVAGPMLFLSGALSSHMTGQTLTIDGGNMVVYNVETPPA